MEEEEILDKELDQGDDENIYSEDVRDRLLEDDKLSPSEVAFMKGYDDAYV